MGYEVPGFKDRWEQIVSCPKCQRSYRQVCSEQGAGFRERDYDICPYCNVVVKSSTKFEYINYVIEEDNVKGVN